MTTKPLKRSWVEISIPTLLKNIQIYQKNIQNNSSIMAVVKADAYGHGAVEVSRALQESGITDFAVSNILEAVELCQRSTRCLTRETAFAPDTLYPGRILHTHKEKSQSFKAIKHIDSFSCLTRSIQNTGISNQMKLDIIYTSAEWF